MGPIIITILLGKHIVVINFVKVCSTADENSQTFNETVTQCNGTCCNILSENFHAPSA
jgi:hypothetical protein